MNLITETLRAQLLANGRQSLDNDDFDPPPVVKLFTPDAGATWLLTEIDPDDHDHAFGLCDLGQGFPELGYVSLAELQSVRGRLGLPIERDLHFVAMKAISQRLRCKRPARHAATTTDRDEYLAVSTHDPPSRVATDRASGRYHDLRHGTAR